MIFPNGRLRFPRAAPGEGIDPATGYARPAEVQWDEGVPCLYVAQEVNYLGVARGERFTAARWIIYINLPHAPRQGLCRLENRHGEPLAEREVMAWTELEAVQQARVLL